MENQKVPFKMKRLMTFDQLNENNSNVNILKDILSKFEEKVDSEKLFKFLLPFKKEMDLLCRKYYNNGKIDADKIQADLKSFNLMTEEMRWRNGRYEEDFDEDETNNVILRYLYKFFIKWPKSFVYGVWEFFEMTVIDTWKDEWLGKAISITSIFMWIIIGVLVYLLSTWAFLFFDMKMNGLSTGKVLDKTFQEAHLEHYTTTIYVGKVPITQYHTRNVPDRWFVELKGENGRIEKWVTYNPSSADSAENGTSITKNDNWCWEDTEKR